MVRSTQLTTFALLFTVLLSLSRVVFATTALSDIRFTEYTREDGIVEDTITSIVEDQHGFIWVGSIEGLFRYDGYHFKKYENNAADSTSIPPGFTRTMYVSRNKDLWIGTYEGLAKYQPDSDSFKIYNRDNSLIRSNEIWSITEDDQGNILVADSSNVYFIDAKTEELDLLDGRVDFPDDIEIIRNEPSRIWIGTFSSGAYIYDKRRRILYPLSSVNPWGFNIPPTPVFVITVIDGDYWIGTNEGILIFNVNGERIKSINTKTYPVLKSNAVRSIKEIAQGEIWFGTEDGLAIYNSVKDRVKLIDAEMRNITYLDNQIIRKIYKDSTSSIWLGTAEGVYRYAEGINILRLYSHVVEEENSGSQRIWAVEEDSLKNLWLATQSSGLGKLNFHEENISYFLTGRPNQLWDLVVDNNDDIWLATSKGIEHYQQTKNGLQLINIYLENEIVDNIHYDGSNLWAWTETNGLVSIEPQSPELNTIAVKYELKYHDLSLRDAIATPVYSDNEGNLWLASTGVMTIFNSELDKVIKEINLTSNQKQEPSRVKTVYLWGNYYWLVTQSAGVYQLDKNTLAQVNHHSLQMNTNVLAAIGLKDSLWMSTESNEIKQFLLPNMELVLNLSSKQLELNDYSESAVSKTRENALVFGGDRGFHYFYPEFLSFDKFTDTPSQQPEILSLKVFGKEQKFDTDSSVLDKPINLKSSLTLSDADTRFSLGFAVLNAVSPSTVKYRYRLTGWDKSWTQAGGERQAPYNNISFGDYLFEVQAKEDGKTWSSSRELNLTILPPPWLHPAALIFYGFFTTIITLYVVRQYHVRRRQRIAVSESEERLKLTLWSSGDELWDWDVYRGQVYRSNTWGTLDFPQDDIRTNSAYDANIHPHDLKRVQDALKEHLSGESEFYEIAYRTKTFNNTWLWILDRGKVVQRDHNHEPIRMTGTLKNIQHLKDAEEQLNLFKRSIENISEGVFITDTRFRFISVNNAYCTYTGETRDQALATYLYFHQYPEAFTEEIKKTLKSRGNWSGEVESSRVNGERYEIELNIDAVHDDDGRISHYVGVFSDITSRKNTEKELLKLANSDPLTELPNRSFFQASHNNLVRRGTPHALLCLDMDNFKKINDSLGHQTGDILIKQIAKRIQRMTDTNSTCYRLGGDEFSILMEDFPDIHTITHFAQSVLNTLARPFIINKQEFVLGASIGIALFPEDGSTPQELLKNADTAMYFAKNNGGNSYQFFSGEMNQNAVRQLQIENLIRQGIKDNLFTVFYQPKVDITTGKLVSMEALVRFEHPNKGIVSPGQFIPLAEQTGQIIEIGEQVLRKACEDTKRWVSEGLFSGRVAVNISAKQFELPDLDDRIESILRQVGLSPLHLECEITEGTLMENPEEALRMMQRLRDRGIHLALDDFGTGYSSLAYLKKFPLNTLKIDKAFIDDIAKSNVDRHMAAAIINIAHNLGLKVVAEGVEYEEQLNILRRYDCEMLQGYLYSKPLNAERFEKLLRENSLLHKIISKVSPN
ncbi:EAL domain-containing protein [Alteromonas lipolytica]|uniref:cyclic-guanylate-specific phosphodiesterase n=1 Tax=Alteromonas lipolytica TaxID=1856405 RepID=A0A1E8FK56_9ALTE|nr:EAL domain-containing protein [Alteromonas lipolytica]OFI35998.1 histidine kinase [Alteromonas lipolytica]GGF71809.1 diguanylate cyclase [Alteromonas lipolytica]